MRPTPAPIVPPAPPARSHSRDSSPGPSTPRSLPSAMLTRADSEVTLAHRDSQVRLYCSPSQESLHKTSPSGRHSLLRNESYSPDITPPLSPAPTLAPTPARRRSADNSFPFPLQYVASQVVSENEERAGPFPDLLPATAPADKVDILDVGPPPDGGREAWLCIMSAFLLLCCMFGFGTYQ